jgi:cell division protein FtsL
MVDQNEYYKDTFESLVESISESAVKVAHDKIEEAHKSHERNQLIVTAILVALFTAFISLSPVLIDWKVQAETSDLSIKVRDLTARYSKLERKILDLEKTKHKDAAPTH